jgi:hypothetical protein
MALPREHREGAPLPMNPPSAELFDGNHWLPNSAALVVAPNEKPLT